MYLKHNIQGSWNYNFLDPGPWTVTAQPTSQPVHVQYNQQADKQTTSNKQAMVVVTSGRVLRALRPALGRSRASAPSLLRGGTTVRIRRRFCLSSASASATATSTGLRAGNASDSKSNSDSDYETTVSPPLSNNIIMELVLVLVENYEFYEKPGKFTTVPYNDNKEC